MQITACARINAPFTRRSKDRIGIGFVYSNISDPFRNFEESIGSPLLGSEKAFELNYAFQVTQVDSSSRRFSIMRMSAAILRSPMHLCSAFTGKLRSDAGDS